MTASNIRTRDAADTITRFDPDKHITIGGDQHDAFDTPVKLKRVRLASDPERPRKY